MFEDLELAGDEAIITGVSITMNPKTNKIGSEVSYLMNQASWKRERAIKCVGLTAVTEFTNEMDCSELVAGDKVRFAYKKGFGGKAVLAGYVLV